MSEAESHQGTNPESDDRAQRELEAEIRGGGPDQHPTLSDPLSGSTGFGGAGSTGSAGRAGVEDAIPIPDYPAGLGDPDEHPTLRTSPVGQESRGFLGNADPLSIGAGLVFFFIGGAYLLASGGHLAVNAGWTLSMLLIGLGLSGVISGLIRSRRSSRRPGR